MSKPLRVLLILMAIVLLLVGGTMLLLESPLARRWLAATASDSLQREVRIGGMDIDWGWPPRLMLTDLSVGNTDWAGPEPMLQSQTLVLTPLAWRDGKLDLDLRLEHPVAQLARGPDGTANWQFGGDEQDTGGGPPARLTRLTVEQGRLTYHDPAAQTRIDTQLAAAPERGLRLTGAGERRGAPFRFDLSGAAVEQLMRPSRPYPVQGTLRSGNTEARIEGRMPESLQFAEGDYRLWIKGPNPAELYPLLGLSLPDLPPYQLEGRLHRQDQEILFSDFRGRFGDSDLAGDLRIRPGKPPRVWATLHSERLDFDDLFPTVGGEPAAEPGETASPEQARASRQEAADRSVFPETPLSFERLHAVNASVAFTGKHVLARKLPLDELDLRAELHGGVLEFKPLRFGLGGGRVDSRIRLDARANPADGAVSLDLRNVNLKPLMQGFGVAEESFGRVGGDGRLRFAGNSIAAAMATLTGELQLVMEGGRLDMFAVEVAGLDLSEAVLAKLSKDQTVPLNCAYARFDADDGQAVLERFFIDTDDSNFTGKGKIDLDAERLSLQFEAHPKDFSVFTLSTPVKIEGSMKKPGVDVLSGEAAARLGLAAVAALLNPLAAVLPLIEPGEGEKAGPGCRKVLTEAKAKEGKRVE